MNQDLQILLRAVEKKPDKVLLLAEKFTQADRLKKSRIESSRAYEWQKRLAIYQSLSMFFDPNLEKKISRPQRLKARELLVKGLFEDPALVVRDQVVECIRRILRMRPTESFFWKAQLEQAFLNSKNSVQGEGLFIRETILLTFKENSWTLTSQMKKEKARDRNPEISKFQM